MLKGKKRNKNTNLSSNPLSKSIKSFPNLFLFRRKTLSFTGNADCVTSLNDCLGGTYNKN